MFTEVVSGALTAYELFEKRNTIAQIFMRTMRFLTAGNSHVGVFGAGGTGKSTLGQFIQGKLDSDVSRADYKETLRIETFKAKGEHPGLLTVVPGQEDRRPGNWDELYQSISSGKSFRVINVVASGYHHTELEKAALAVYDKNMSDEDLVSAWIDYSLSEEIKAIREILPHLMSAPGEIRMVTLVTNQDLWWHNRQNVKQYYDSGPYAAEFKEIYKRKGQAGFKHSLVSCALLQQNLRTADGFVIAPVASGYDDGLRVANLDKVATAISAMIEK